MKRTVLGFMAMMIMWFCASCVATYGCSYFMDDHAMMVVDNTIPDAMSGRIRVDHKDLITDSEVVVDEQQASVISTSPESDIVSVVPVDVPDLVTVAPSIDVFSGSDLVVAAPIDSTPAGSESDLIVATPVSDFTDPVGIFKEAKPNQSEQTEEKFIIPVEPVYNVAPKFDLVNAVPVNDQASSPIRFIAGNGVTIETAVNGKEFSSRVESDPILSGRYSGEAAAIPRVQFSASRIITVGESKIRSATGTDLSNLIGSETLSSYKRTYAYPISENDMAILSSAS